MKTFKQFCNESKDTVWVKCECEKGNRWTFPKGGISDTTEEHRKDPTCFFDGCKQNHKYSIVGETTSREEAQNWFKNIYE